VQAVKENLIAFCLCSNWLQFL